MITERENESKLAKYYWHPISGYAAKSFWKEVVFAHHLIIDIPKGMYPDHKNGNRLDNRSSNLRLAERWQNATNRSKGKNNTSGVTGVESRGDKWIARIQANHTKLFLGYFDSFEEACVARRNAEEKYHGEFRRIA